MPSLTFAHLDRVPIDVGALHTGGDYEGFTEAFVVSPADALETYLHSRFEPTGFEGVLRAGIEEASVNHSFEPSENKVGNYLNVAGFDVYDMTLVVRLEHIDRDDHVKYGTVLTARRIVRISEHASVAQREQDQLRALEGMFGDIDRKILKIVLSDMKLGMAP